MDTEIITGQVCKHGTGCARVICRVLAQIEAEKAAGIYSPIAKERKSDVTFPGFIRSRHNLQGRA